MVVERKSITLRWMAALCPVVLLGACTTLQPPSPEERVAQRAQERWDHLIAGEFDAAYGYLSPAQRTTGSLEAYRRHLMLSRVEWKEASVLDVECGAEACTARIQLDMVVVQPLPRVPAFDASQTIDEQWVLVESEWWHVPK